MFRPGPKETQLCAAPPRVLPGLWKEYALRQGVTLPIQLPFRARADSCPDLVETARHRTEPKRLDIGGV